MKPVQEPTIVEDGDRGTTITHPAFGQIVASRVSGSQPLYGSDFHHHHFMQIRIKRSELRRDLSRDWHHGREELIEVSLTEAQWATFVSSPNMGDGVPCTIEHIQWEQMPRLPSPSSRADQFAMEIEKKLADSIKQIEVAIAEVDDLGLPKDKAQKIKGRLNSTLRELASNAPYVAEAFEEHVEATVEKGKAEIHGYMQSAVQRAGLEALTGGQLPLQIAAPRAEQES